MRYSLQPVQVKQLPNAERKGAKFAGQKKGQASEHGRRKNGFSSMGSHAEQPGKVTRPHIVDHRNGFQKIRPRQLVNCQNLNLPESEARKRRRAVVHGSNPCHDDPKSNFTCYGLFFFS